MRIRKSTELTLDSFLSLPRRAQLIVFEDLESSSVHEQDTNPYLKYAICGFDTGDCKSPIEKILCFVSCVFCYKNDLDYELIPQEEIICNDKKYIADFVVYDYARDRSIPLIIECDGHEFHHSTKAQVKKDNQRDYDLKLAGYEVLHFSGSQIYEDPIKCVADIFRFAKKYNKPFTADDDSEKGKE